MEFSFKTIVPFLEVPNKRLTRICKRMVVFFPTFYDLLQAPSVGQLSANSQPTVGRLSGDCWLTVG